VPKGLAKYMTRGKFGECGTCLRDAAKQENPDCHQKNFNEGKDSLQSK